jgi:hypothetical protein
MEQLKNSYTLLAEERINNRLLHSMNVCLLRRYTPAQSRADANNF